MGFDYDLDFKHIDFRKHPEKYKVGRGEQGVLLVEPYKSEILPHWRFKTPEIAKESSEKIYQLFWNTKRRMILLEWIWRENFCRWAIPGPDDTRIIRVGGNTIKKAR